MLPIQSQAPDANRAAIAAILSDVHDEPLRNKATRVALEILKQVPDLPVSRGEVMLTSLARYAGNSFVACSTSNTTVLFMGKHAFVLASDGRANVPWISTDKLNVPDMSFFKYRVRVDDDLSSRLLGYVQALMQAEQLAADAALAHAAEQEESDAPAP